MIFGRWRFRQQLDERDGVVVWRWFGRLRSPFRFSEKAQEAARSLHEEIAPELPILLDMTEFRHDHGSRLENAILAAVYLHQVGRRVAVLIPPTPSVRNFIEATKVATAIGVFEDEDRGVAHLRTPDRPAPPA